MISAGQFRQDLYYRIATFEIQVAPLRERRSDISSLVLHFLKKLSIQARLERPATIADDALSLLSSYDWPGNVRELENVINRLIVVATQSAITRDDVESVLGVIYPTQIDETTHSQSKAITETRLVLAPSASELSEDETIGAYMRRVKLDVLTAAITQYPNRTAAAQRLGLTKEALKRQLRYLRNATRSTAMSTNDQEEL